MPVRPLQVAVWSSNNIQDPHLKVFTIVLFLMVFQEPYSQICTSY